MLVPQTRTARKVNAQATSDDARKQMAVSMLLNSPVEERKASKDQLSFTQPTPLEVDAHRSGFPRHHSSSFEDRSSVASSSYSVNSDYTSTCRLPPIGFQQAVEEVSLPDYVLEHERRNSLPSLASQSLLPLSSTAVNQQTLKSPRSTWAGRFYPSPPEERKSLPSSRRYPLRRKQESVDNRLRESQQTLIKLQPSTRSPPRRTSRSRRLVVQEFGGQASSYHHHFSPPLSSRQIERPPHCNIPYTVPQDHRLRYLKEDKGLNYQDIIVILNHACPSIRRDNEGQGASARYYRTCLYPQVDSDFNFVRDADGKINQIQVPIRQRSQVRFKDWPYLLVEMFPRWAVFYSWVTDEDKRRARAILKGEDEEYYHSVKDRMRRSIELWEEENPKIRAEFRKLKSNVNQTDTLNIIISSGSEIIKSEYLPPAPSIQNPTVSNPHRRVKKERERSIENGNDW